MLAIWQVHIIFPRGHRRGLLLLDLTRALFLFPLGPHSRFFGLFLCVSPVFGLLGLLIYLRLFPLKTPYLSFSLLCLLLEFC